MELKSLNTVMDGKFQDCVLWTIWIKRQKLYFYSQAKVRVSRANFDSRKCIFTLTQEQNIFSSFDPKMWDKRSRKYKTWGLSFWFGWWKAFNRKVMQTPNVCSHNRNFPSKWVKYFLRKQFFLRLKNGWVALFAKVHQLTLQYDTAASRWPMLDSVQTQTNKSLQF